MLMADQMAEALMAMRAAGIEPLSTTPLPPSWTPHVMRLPDWAFRTIAGAMVKIDPEARLSMWEDLRRGRRTEIDYLQGAIIALADGHGLTVPLSRRVVELVKAAEARRQGSPGLIPEQIRGGTKS
jgi:2-dehydropantoate 2-reductase